ncbi:MFS transporter [Streptomyces nigrescens]|uniref:MFS transporter n=2 Tax=Streptomyces TaxID=1883 RepID=A0ABM7ZZJ2_STRNI|nr:MFS transporter [Streptomyces nigrescens]MEE4422677.1 MFS transporter [Streptomyces sp. DSM 41528]BDM71780.1 MFS transporter [Streptomyces nigrescens]
MPRQPATPGERSGLPLYLATAFFARLADEGMAVAVVLLAVDRTGSAAQGAFVLTAWMAPHVVAAPLVGALAPRVRRLRLCHLGALGVFAAAIAVLSQFLGRAPLPVTLGVALAGGACGPVVSGGLSSLIAVLLPTGGRRDRAYALDATVYNAASVAGPAVVSAVAALASPGAATLLLGGAAALGAALAGGLPFGHTEQPAPGAAPATTLRTDLMAGLAAVWRTRELRAITAATCLAFGGLGGLTTTTVLLAAHRGQPGAGGALMTAFALGALIGSLLVARRQPPLPDHRLATVALCGTGLALAAAALLPSPVAGPALFALAGVCDGPLLTATLRIRAAHAPARTRAQVFTLGAGLKFTAAAVGATLVGAAAALPPALLLAGIAGVQLAAAALHALLRPRTSGRDGAPSTPEGTGARPVPSVRP